MKIVPGPSPACSHFTQDTGHRLQQPLYCVQSIRCTAQRTQHAKMAWGLHLPAPPSPGVWGAGSSTLPTLSDPWSTQFRVPHAQKCHQGLCLSVPLHLGHKAQDLVASFQCRIPGAHNSKGLTCENGTGACTCQHSLHLGHRAQDELEFYWTKLTIPIIRRYSGIMVHLMCYILSTTHLW